MSTTQEKTEQATETATVSLLDKAIQATKQTTPDRTKDLLTALTDAAMQGTIKWDKNLTATIQQAIAAIDQQISKQLAEVMHAKEFRNLEGSWQGMRYLVKNTLCGTDLKIKVLNVKKAELLKDFNKALEFDQTDLFKKIYEYEFGTPGGEPYSAMIGDFEFTNHPDDLDF